jgi:hypothetical protein
MASRQIHDCRINAGFSTNAFEVATQVMRCDTSPFAAWRVASPEDADQRPAQASITYMQQAAFAQLCVIAWRSQLKRELR